MSAPPPTWSALLLALGASCWLACLVLGMALLVIRIRPPSLLFWAGPAAFTLLALGAALSVDPTPRTFLPALLRADAAGLLASALLVAIAQLRAGPGAKWTPFHAASTVPVFALCPVGTLGTATLAQRVETCSAALLGLTAVALASLRLGTGADGRRTATARVLVASFGGIACLCLAAAHHLTGPGWGLGAVAASALPILGGAIAVAPAARLLIDLRASAGFVTSFLLILFTAAAVLALGATPEPVPTVDPLQSRLDAIERAGIELPSGSGNARWRPGTTVTVGLYWARIDGRRVLPYRRGEPVPEALDALDAALPRPIDHLVLEADRRAGISHLRPLLERASSICLVVRETPERLGCIDARPTDRTSERHLLLRPDELVLIDPDGTRPLTPGEPLPGDEPLTVHLHPDLTVEQIAVALRSLDTELWFRLE